VGEGTDSTATTLIEGPALVRVEVNYKVDYMCPGAQTLDGTSTFTMLPTGRIVRRDSIQPSTDTLAPNATCGCESGSGDLTFSTFYAFDAQAAQQVDAAGATLGDGTPQGCTIYPDAAIGVAFNPGDGTPRSSGAGAHILDFERNTASLPNTRRETTSAIQIFSDDDLAPSFCEDILGLLAVVNLSVNGEPRTTDLDGVFDDEGVVHTGPITLEPIDDPIPPGFAIQLDLGGATHATVSRPVDRVFRQRGPGNTYFFVFPDELDVGDSITIVPE
jgi:hypothetical protein